MGASAAAAQQSPPHVLHPREVLLHTTTASGSTAVQRVGLVAGVLAFAVLLALPGPAALSPEAWRTVALAVLMGIWWLTEAIPIPVTALLPLVLLPALGVLSMADAAAPYASDIIFLFMGGFFLAAGMEGSGLHRRVALGIISRFGSGSGRLVLGFMLATGFLSMWINNTATTAMMLPIAIAVSRLFDDGDAVGNRALAVCMMLGIAWASSIGGVATLIGTAPNLVLAAATAELLGVSIGFGSWMLVGVPVAAVMLPAAWFILVRITNRPGELPEGAAAMLASRRAELGPRSRHETIVAVVFAATALAWVMREPKALGVITLPGITTWFPAVRDSTIAMAGALVLFLWPLDLGRGRFALDWQRAQGIPWGVLILFGGGLSLARAMDRTGLAAAIGSIFTEFAGMPGWAIFALVAAVFVFLTEFTSNTATSTMAMPILAGAATGLGQPAITLMATAAMAASMAFMLPVGTPPNAMVFASGQVTIPAMARAGLWLNVAAITVITAAATWLVPFLAVRSVL